MSAHWRLALSGAAWMAVLAVPVGAAIFFFYSAAHAWSFAYGAGNGILSLVSTALTVSLLTGRSMTIAMMVGAASFAGRLAFAAAALGIPAYLELWPVLPMLAGFAGVYVAENVVLLPRAPKIRREVGKSLDEKIERRAEV